MSDAVSREAILIELNRLGVKAFNNYSVYSVLFDFVTNLPAENIDMERPTGKWIKAQGGYVRCNLCHKAGCFGYNFCPNCGAEMRVKDELNERPQTISCFNCKHDYKTETEEPCKYCNEKFSEWRGKGGRE